MKGKRDGGRSHSKGPNRFHGWRRNILNCISDNKLHSWGFPCFLFRYLFGLGNVRHSTDDDDDGFSCSIKRKCSRQQLHPGAVFFCWNSFTSRLSDLWQPCQKTTTFLVFFFYPRHCMTLVVEIHRCISSKHRIWFSLSYCRSFNNMLLPFRQCIFPGCIIY